MKPAAGMPSQLQVLPQSVQFDDVNTEQQLQTTVIVKVNAESLLVPGIGMYWQLITALQSHNLEFCVPQNLDSRQHILRWKPPKSKLFQVQGLATISKLAPGLQLSFKV